MTLVAPHLTLQLDGIYFETPEGRQFPEGLAPQSFDATGPAWQKEVTMPGGRIVRAMVEARPSGVAVKFSATPDDDIRGWGFAVDAEQDEYFTGLMERVVDGPQKDSWAPGITAALNLHGQHVDMLVKPTTSLYAPFYLSSRGYAIGIEGTWPGSYDFAAARADRVQIDFDGPQLAFNVYLSDKPAALITAHAMDVGPPVLPPKWVFGPWRWRDEHTQRATYYNGTRVNGPFNSEVMEDVLMMQAYGIPNSVYWIDRPWGPGAMGYDDFRIDEQRLPNFEAMVRWLKSLDQRTVLWIAPFLQGEMASVGQQKGYTLRGQPKPQKGSNYPLVDFSNPDGRRFWQDGVASLIKMGVTGFKLDRSEEDIPDSGPEKIFDGRSLREQRNDYPVMYVKAAFDAATPLLGNDFVMMPRAAYTGSTRYGIFWGGDIGGTQEGLRASIIAIQRAAVMGYPVWGSDTCGYNEQLMEQEVCGRWLAFSALSPLMEVGPTRNVAFWNMPRAPEYDAPLIATWRMYARLHERLRDYSHQLASEAHASGMPIIRPMFIVEPSAPAAWNNWWTYEYGPDLVVSPVWQKGARERQVYLPTGNRWRNAWKPDQVFDGGQTVTVAAEAHQLPLFIREGSALQLGDLNREWEESRAAAGRKPDLAVLEKTVTQWFARNGRGPPLF